jgi:hypothetical protein
MQVCDGPCSTRNTLLARRQNEEKYPRGLNWFEDVLISFDLWNVRDGFAIGLRVIFSGERLSQVFSDAH